MFQHFFDGAMGTLDQPVKMIQLREQRVVVAGIPCRKHGLNGTTEFEERQVADALMLDARADAGTV